MQKILFVIKTGGFGGLEVILLDWLAAIDESNTSVVLLCRNDVYSDALARKGIKNVACFQLDIPDDLSTLRAFRRWRSLFSSIRPDKIVFLEGGVGEFRFAAILAARQICGPDVFIYESLAPRPFIKGKRKLHFGFLPGLGLYRLKEKCETVLRGYLSQKTLVMSGSMQKKMIEYFGYPPHKIAVHHHGIDTERFTPSPEARREFRRANGIPEDAVVIVSHGRLHPVKRVDRILSAYEILASKCENVWLLLTAYGPLTAEVETLVASKEIYRHVKLLGFQSDTTLVLKASDIYVLASDNEGFGIALVEAMSTGLVCVATNTSGPGEILEDGQNGYLVEVSDGAVLDGLRRALELTKEQAGTLGRNARKTCLEKFEINSAVGKVLYSLGIDSGNSSRS